MARVDWRDEYCTGDDRIDQEHRSLFVMVNELDEAIAAAAPPSQIQGILSTLAAHTIEHFRHEEALMVDLDYPGYGRHKQVHDNLVAKVTALVERFNQPNATLANDLTNFLTEWLSHHIKGEDQNMIRFFRSRTHANAMAQR